MGCKVYRAECISECEALKQKMWEVSVKRKLTMTALIAVILSILIKWIFRFLMERVASKGEKILPVEIMGFLTNVYLFNIANKSIRE